jgi:Ca2+-binding EF-hand superfamily protein
MMKDLSQDQVMRLRELSVEYEKNKNEEMVREMFSIFDRNNNGKIELREFISGMSEALNEELPDLEWVQIFKGIDTNKDGEIEYEEFLAWISQDS